MTSEEGHMQAVKELGNAARNEKTVAGLGRTLKALNSDRVWELIYKQRGRYRSVFESEGCESLTARYCGRLA